MSPHTHRCADTYYYTHHMHNIYIHIHMHTHALIHMYMVYTCTHVCIYMFKVTHTFICIYTHEAHPYTKAHIYSCTHIYTPVHTPVLSEIFSYMYHKRGAHGITT